MTIKEMDPDDFVEFVESDSIVTGLLKPEALNKYIHDPDKMDKIMVEGMELRLNGFHKIVKDGSEGILFIKINLELGQFLYTSSDNPGSEEILAHFMPQFMAASEQTGLALVDVRTVATESLGSMKRVKGVTSTEDLMNVLAKERLESMKKEADKQVAKVNGDTP